MYKNRVSYDGFCPEEYERGLSEIYKSVKKAHEKGVHRVFGQVINSVARNNEAIKEMVLGNRYLTIAHDVLNYKNEKDFPRKDLSQEVA